MRKEAPLELTCANCLSGNFSLERVPESHSAGTFLLTCSSCGKPVRFLPFHSIEDWLRRQDDMPPSERLAVETDAGRGYYPGAYLRAIGLSDIVDDVLMGKAWPFGIDLAKRPPLILEPPA